METSQSVWDMSPEAQGDWDEVEEVEELIPDTECKENIRDVEEIPQEGPLKLLRTVAGTADIGLFFANGSSVNAKASPSESASATAAVQSDKSKSTDSASKSDIELKPAEFKPLFKVNPKFPDSSKASHICITCAQEVAITIVADGKTKRDQWANGKNHVKACHSVVYNQLFAKKRSLEASASIAASNEAARLAREELLAKNASLSVGTHKYNVTDMLDIDEAPPKPLLEVPRLNSHQAKVLQFSMALWAATDGMSQNSFEKPGFRKFANVVGLPASPCPETVRGAQAYLAAKTLEKIKRHLSLIAGFSPLPLISCQTDVWTAHDGCQQMGVRLTLTNPFDVSAQNFILPLEAASGGSLHADAEANLVRAALFKVGLGTDTLYSQTTDSAAVATLSAVLNNIRGITCKAHIAALVLKDCITLADSKELDLDQDFAETDAVSSHFLGVAARAAHMHRSALAERALLEWQCTNKYPPLKFKQWSLTRWTGAYEALLRDTEIMKKGGGVDFMKEYVRNKESSLTAKAKAKLQLGILDNGGVQLLSIMKPLYDLTLKLQADEISLADAYILILETADLLSSPLVQMVNEKGSLTDIQVPITDMKESFGAFRKKMRDSLMRRMVDDVDDETVTSILLDPKRFHDLGLIADCSNIDETETALFHKDIVSAAEIALSRMDRYESQIQSKMRSVVRQQLMNKPSQLEAKATGPEEPQGVKDNPAKPCDDDVKTADSVANTSSKLSSLKRQKMLAKVAPAPDDSDDVYKLVKAEFEAFQIAREQQFELGDLAFWRKNSQLFPSLYHVFLGSRSARPASARLESAFSTANALVPAQRMSMSIETLNNLLILKTNDVSVKDLMFAADAWIKEKSKKMARVTT